MKRLLPFLLLLTVGCSYTVHNGTLYVDWIRNQPVNPTVVVDPVNPTPSKFASKNLICLVLEDYKNGATLSTAQGLALNSSNLRKFLNENCLPDSAKQPMYRLRIDKDSELTGPWKTLATPMPTKFPALLMQNGDNFYREPLPEKVEDIESAINEYAGAPPK